MVLHRLNYWMKNLKSFVVLGSYDTNSPIDDTCETEGLPWITKDLLDYLYEVGAEPPSDRLERIWISGKRNWPKFTIKRYSTSQIKSLQLTTPEMYMRDLFEDQFLSNYLEHLAEFKFRDYQETIEGFLPKLKYIHGTCYINDQVLY